MAKSTLKYSFLVAGMLVSNLALAQHWSPHLTGERSAFAPSLATPEARKPASPTVERAAARPREVRPLRGGRR